MSGGVPSGGGVVCVLGTRPEAIKLAPVVLALAARGVAVTLCSTGQQRDLTRATLDDFGLVPNIDLDLMKPDQSPQVFVATALPLLGQTIARLAPAMVIVQGDTATTLAGAMAAAYTRVPVAHVEAGLRSGTAEPFPEDMHRRVIAQLATHHFAPTQIAQAALVREGIAWGAISVTGNPVIDALRLAEARLGADPALRAGVDQVLPPLREGRALVLVTAHRRENHVHMASIAAAVAAIAAAHDVDIVVPLHPNPASGAVLRGRLEQVTNVALVQPLGYLAFVTLLRRARLVLTDSGGVQEEAPAFGCPVLVLRDSTERPEGIEAGAARLVGTDPATIVAAVAGLITDDAVHAAMTTAILPYGDGYAADRIAAIVAAEIVRR
ncbi:UDP-N-acetylglucosamine 2-epimerase (non-hydrolyzing) [Polymorphobacter sp. PAMC 29334]|uniref:non-hydrolyzing UDP-N-acetylglucosamine 2-epimerase n=1 Tax=Polymorphobacter sp. PAMC 29334 TaxID=2862331 RepID=UPI001C795233|nr:UDP-N-acetylglucosamine 2-epimerase (non-hydrolyzing) [Polymorphobacter sp. PAMC 29334]QYE35351.1 UDP-N-acetylglucosamine 2-epimerase (non-hydrolyzing) [Polymorphobacter sp. PAMC 29334]